MWMLGIDVCALAALFRQIQSSRMPTSKVARNKYVFHWKFNFIVRQKLVIKIVIHFFIIIILYSFRGSKCVYERFICSHIIFGVRVRRCRRHRLSFSLWMQLRLIIWQSWYVWSETLAWLCLWLPDISIWRVYVLCAVRTMEFVRWIYTYFCLMPSYSFFYCHLYVYRNGFKYINRHKMKTQMMRQNHFVLCMCRESSPHYTHTHTYHKATKCDGVIKDKPNGNMWMATFSIYTHTRANTHTQIIALNHYNVFLSSSSQTTKNITLL